MRRMLVSRISRRVLAEHHIALSETFMGRGRETNREPHVGIIFTGLNVKQSVERCTKLLSESALWSTGLRIYDDNETRKPEVHIEGHLDTTFAYIREHLEYVLYDSITCVQNRYPNRYIIFELLKNVSFAYLTLVIYLMAAAVNACDICQASW